MEADKTSLSEILCGAQNPESTSTVGPVLPTFQFSDTSTREFCPTQELTVDEDINTNRNSFSFEMPVTLDVPQSTDVSQVSTENQVFMVTSHESSEDSRSTPNFGSAKLPSSTKQGSYSGICDSHFAVEAEQKSIISSSEQIDTDLEESGSGDTSGTSVLEHKDEVFIKYGASRLESTSDHENSESQASSRRPLVLESNGQAEAFEQGAACGDLSALAKRKTQSPVGTHGVIDRVITEKESQHSSENNDESEAHRCTKQGGKEAVYEVFEDHVCMASTSASNHPQDNKQQYYKSSEPNISIDGSSICSEEHQELLPISVETLSIDTFLEEDSFARDSLIVDDEEHSHWYQVGSTNEELEQVASEMNCPESSEKEGWVEDVSEHFREEIASTQEIANVIVPSVDESVTSNIGLLNSALSYKECKTTSQEHTCSQEVILTEVDNFSPMGINPQSIRAGNMDGERNKSLQEKFQKGEAESDASTSFIPQMPGPISNTKIVEDFCEKNEMKDTLSMSDCTDKGTDRSNRSLKLKNESNASEGCMNESSQLTEHSPDDSMLQTRTVIKNVDKSSESLVSPQYATLVLPNQERHNKGRKEEQNAEEESRHIVNIDTTNITNFVSFVADTNENERDQTRPGLNKTPAEIMLQEHDFVSETLTVFTTTEENNQCESEHHCAAQSNKQLPANSGCPSSQHVFPEVPQVEEVAQKMNKPEAGVCYSLEEPMEKPGSNDLAENIVFQTERRENGCHGPCVNQPLEGSSSILKRDMLVTEQEDQENNQREISGERKPGTEDQDCLVSETSSISESYSFDWSQSSDEKAYAFAIEPAKTVESRTTSNLDASKPQALPSDEADSDVDVLCNVDSYVSFQDLQTVANLQHPIELSCSQSIVESPGHLQGGAHGENLSRNSDQCNGQSSKTQLGVVKTTSPTPSSMSSVLEEQDLVENSFQEDVDDVKPVKLENNATQGLPQISTDSEEFELTDLSDLKDVEVGLMDNIPPVTHNTTLLELPSSTEATAMSSMNMDESLTEDNGDEFNIDWGDYVVPAQARTSICTITSYLLQLCSYMYWLDNSKYHICLEFSNTT